MPRAARSDLADVEVIYQTATAKAVCVRADEGSADVWLPLSQCEVACADGSEPRRGRVCVLTASEWLLIDRGLL